MKIAVICSSGSSTSDLAQYLPPNSTEILSVGQQGLSEAAKRYAAEGGIQVTEIILERKSLSRNDFLRRNLALIRKTDLVIAFWDGLDEETKLLIDQCNILGIPIRVFV